MVRAKRPRYPPTAAFRQPRWHSMVDRLTMPTGTSARSSPMPLYADATTAGVANCHTGDHPGFPTTPSHAGRSFHRELEKDDVPTAGGHDAACGGAGNGVDVARQADSVGVTAHPEIPDSHRAIRASGDGDGAAVELGADHCGDPASVAGPGSGPQP